MSTDLYESLKPLIDQNGIPVGEGSFYGAVSLVFFGFTHCAKVCPRALQSLSKVLMTLHDSGKHVNGLYISVDPGRDDSKAMKSFLDRHAPKFVGLTGAEADLESVRKAFRVFAQRRENKNDTEAYDVPHTALTYVLDQSGRLVDHFGDDFNREDATARILQVANRGSQQDQSENINPRENAKGRESLLPPRLSKEQVASIRHIGNLSRQLKGDWSNMMSGTDLNDGFGAYRFQLSYAFYALALAHFHRLPAAPGVFQHTLASLISKMCETDVWFYWRDASRGGGVGNTPPRAGATNPIAEENIMYSAYLQSMTALYNSLFDDDRYMQPGSLTLEHEPFFWGNENFRFEYDQKSINDLIYWQMVENGYIGVACEPGCIFQNCNQPPILGFRLNDELYGSKVADEVTAGYVKAWENYGGHIDEKGAVRFYLIQHSQVVVPSVGPGADAWCLLLMHAWNPDFAMHVYDDQKHRWLTCHADNTISVKVDRMIGRSENIMRLLKGAEHGWVAAAAAEMGDAETLSGLLEFADQRLSPRYQNGGLTYPRSDVMFDKDGTYVISSPIQSNALLPLARLNVPNGFQRLYEKPWGPKNSQHYGEPALTLVDFSLDIYRAIYVADAKALFFDVSTSEAGTQGLIHVSRIVGRGNWELTREGRNIAAGSNSGILCQENGTDLKQDGDGLVLGISNPEVVSYILRWK